MGFQPTKNRQKTFVRDQQQMRRQVARERDQVLLQPTGKLTASQIVARSEQPNPVRKMGSRHTTK